jgi:hypothetical protein
MVVLGTVLKGWLALLVPAGVNTCTAAEHQPHCSDSMWCCDMFSPADAYFTCSPAEAMQGPVEAGTAQQLL